MSERPIKEEVDELISELSSQMKKVEELRAKVYSKEKGFFLTSANHDDFVKYVREHSKISKICKELEAKLMEYHHEG